VPVAGRRSEAVMKARRRRWSEGEKEEKVDQKNLSEAPEDAHQSHRFKEERGRETESRATHSMVLCPSTPSSPSYTVNNLN
jgi:hypothetical protein